MVSSLAIKLLNLRVLRRGGTGLPVEPVGVLPLQDAGDGLGEDEPVVELEELPVLGGELGLPAPLLPADGDLVVAVPEHDRGVVPEPPHVVHRLPPDVADHLLVARVHRAREHHVVPDQQPLLVAQLVENVVVVLPAAPEAQHVLVRLQRVVDDAPVDLGVSQRFRHEHLRRDVVAAPHVHVHAVYVY